jgi:hypothetical protein
MSLHRGELNWQNSKILFLETSISSLLFNLRQLVHLLTHDYDSYWFTYCLCELEEEVIFLVAYLLFNVMIWTYTMSGWMKESMIPTNFYLI